MTHVFLCNRDAGVSKVFRDCGFVGVGFEGVLALLVEKGRGGQPEERQCRRWTLLIAVYRERWL